ncbi:ABC transporter substrate-binding protein [Paenibacillus thalictri]|uniref:Sugar ABC transporter substrate-binding protein n=1 Tax=Paenibacillus thalictri TaxID=2527873 RepID=A0A4Q9DR40_9BACL|nr:sugar ABC transporter substrate-binding protein [Paenibacillus thalictri]TBL79069.1 sugar ABC transporter substrate-binding protein [Paenibacillus thalictri]
MSPLPLRLTVLFLWIMLLLLLAGCSFSGIVKKPDSASSSEPFAAADRKTVTLRYLIWNSDYSASYQKMFAEFNKEYPGIKVDLQVVPWGNYWDKLMTEIAGGKAPDLYWGYFPRFPGFIDKAAVLDLTNYMKRDHVDLSKYNSSMLQAYASDGKQYAIPQSFGAMGIIYNRDLLMKAGFDSYPEGLEWNPVDGGSFVRFLQRLTLDKEGRHPDESGFDADHIVQYGFNFIDKDQVDPGQLIGLIASNGGTFMKDGRLALDDKLRETYQFVYDLVFKYHVMPNFQDIHTGGSENKFLSGQTAVWMNGQWMMKPLKDKAGFDWAVGSLPKGPAGTFTLVAGLGDLIYSGTKHPEEAWQLVKFMAGPKAQNILAESGIVFPAYEDAISRFLETYRKIGIDAQLFVDGYNGATVVSPGAKNYGEWYQVFVKYTGLMLSGDIDPRTALDRLKQEGDVAANQ